MSESINGNSRIDGWKGIADYLGRDVTTVIRWANVHGLPVNRAQPGQPRRGVFALRHELDAWMASHRGGDDEGNSEDSEVGWSSDAVHHPEDDSSAVAFASGSVPLPQAVPAGQRRWKIQALIAASGLILILILFVAVWTWSRSNPLMATPRLSGVKQLTFNGLLKDGLRTDGRNLYFGQDEHGTLALASMPVQGGNVKILWNPHFNVAPVDYTASAKALLLLGFENIENERQLWVYPLTDGQPHWVGNIRAHSAVWSPNGKKIAYAYGQAIYLANANGTGKRELASFTGIPNMLQWSRDGRQLHFVVQDPATFGSKMFEIVSSDGMRTFSIRSVPWRPNSDVGYGWSPTGQHGTYVIEHFGPTRDDSLYFVHYRTHWWEPLIQIKRVHTGLLNLTCPSMLPSDRRLFVMHSGIGQHGVIEYAPRTRQTRYILNNDSVGYIDPSRDGKWLAWTGLAGKGLSIARVDGSHKRSFAAVDGFWNIELPRWSPNGKEIAFMGAMPHHPWRDYILRVSDGSLHEASQGDSNQGAPTWSPNGKYLLYGNVMCQETDSCAIHRIDLATGKVETISGSKGLMTARWSPNGKYIVAIQPTRFQVMLFNVASQKWSLLAKGIDGADLSWSRNSQHIYADIVGAKERIVRIVVSTGAETTVLNLNQTDRFNLTTAHDAVFCPGPDGTLILPWPSPDAEIYSFRVSGM